MFGHRRPDALVRVGSSLKERVARRELVRFLRPRVADIQRVANERPRGPQEPRRVFFYWAQGLADAPALVQLCFRRLQEHHGPDQVVLLHDGNLDEWVRLPAHVVTKLGGNKTALSDVVRLELLCDHGGVWVDATCLLRSNVLEATSSLRPAGFFAFTRNDRPLATWLLVSERDGYVVRAWREAMHLYWAHYNRPVTYFWSHYLFGALHRLDADFRDRWDATPRVWAGPPHALGRALAEPYDADRFQALLDGSFVHKLTHKFDPDLLRRDTMIARLLAAAPPQSPDDDPVRTSPRR